MKEYNFLKHSDREWDVFNCGHLFSNSFPTPYPKCMIEIKNFIKKKMKVNEILGMILEQFENSGSLHECSFSINQPVPVYCSVVIKTGPVKCWWNAVKLLSNKIMDSYIFQGVYRRTYRNQWLMFSQEVYLYVVLRVPQGGSPVIISQDLFFDPVFN